MGLIKQREGLSEQGSSKGWRVALTAFFTGVVKQLGGCKR